MFTYKYCTFNTCLSFIFIDYYSRSFRFADIGIHTRSNVYSLDSRIILLAFESCSPRIIMLSACCCLLLNIGLPNWLIDFLRRQGGRHTLRFPIRGLHSTRTVVENDFLGSNAGTKAYVLFQTIFYLCVHFIQTRSTFWHDWVKHILLFFKTLSFISKILWLAFMATQSNKK